MGQKGDIQITGVVALVSGATATVDASQGNYFTFTAPAGNVTLTLANVKPGHTIRLEFTQDGTGSRTITWAGQTLSAFTAGKLQPATAANSVTIIEITGRAVNLSAAAVTNNLAQ